MARGTLERRTTPVARAAMPRSRSYTLAFDSRTAWDFLISAALGDQTDHDMAPTERDWYDRARTALGEEQRATLDRGFGGLHASVFHGLPTIVAERSDVRSAADVVDLLAYLDPRELVRAMIRDCLTDEVAPELIDAAAEGDGAAIDTLEPLLCEEGAADAIRRFTADPADAMRRAVAIARTWLAAFEEIEPRLARIHAADVALRRPDLDALPPDEAIERITGGLRFLPEPRVRRVLLGPSVFARPFNHIYQGSDWRLFCYPVSDGVLESDAGTPSASMVRLFRALGDPSRLQVLRLLTEREWYLTELATQLGLSKPTMKHHLALLRAAGLVTVTEEGNLTYYSLRRERLDEAGLELRHYLS